MMDVASLFPPARISHRARAGDGLRVPTRARDGDTKFMFGSALLAITRAVRAEQEHHVPGELRPGAILENVWIENNVS
jgi:hypothetical protein